MKNNTAPGLTALDIINPNAKISAWLDALAENCAISRQTLEDAAAHFGLKRSAAAWLLFLRRVFVLLGVVLFVAGLIFFMAWNWEDLSRFAKFAILELVFILFGAYSLLRWPQNGSGKSGWDARIALLGAALCIGGLLALYGQVYQTGADAWELFRAWTVMLLILALPGRATVFWFMVWLAGNAWLGLYLSTVLALTWSVDGYIFTLFMALAQFVMLTVNEAVSRILNRRGISYDSGRWLSRIIGCAAIALMGSFAVSYLALFAYAPSSFTIFGGIYLLSLVATFIVYYKFIPELLFLSLSIFSAATFIGVKISELVLKNSRFEAGLLLMIGLMILALAFASLKLILVLRKSIRARAKKQASEASEAGHSLGIFKSRAAKQAELKEWLLARAAAEPEDIEACYADGEAEQDVESPWYAKVFITIGVWIGSALSLGAFTFLMFEGLRDPQPLGVAGIILCGLAVHLGNGKKLSMRAFSQVLGVCGLIYAACLFEFDKDPTALLLALLFALFWLLKPPFAARLGAFLGLLACIFVFFEASYYRSSGVGISVYIKTGLYVLGLLWAAHFLVVMDARAPARLSPPSGAWLRKRFSFQETLAASAYACLIFFAGMAFAGPLDMRMIAGSVFILDYYLGSAIVFAALTGLITWRYPAARTPALLVGLPLAGLAWFAPYLALGFGLLLLAFHTGKNAFLGAATAYLGLGVYTYYYNLELSLLYKSLVLMGGGVFFLALGIFLARFGLKEQLQ